MTFSERKAARRGGRTVEKRAYYLDGRTTTYRVLANDLGVVLQSRKHTWRRNHCRCDWCTRGRAYRRPGPETIWGDE